MLNCTVTSQLAHFRFGRNRFCSEAVAPLRCTAVAQMVMMIMLLLVITVIIVAGNGAVVVVVTGRGRQTVTAVKIDIFDILGRIFMLLGRKARRPPSVAERVAPFFRCQDVVRCVSVCRNCELRSFRARTEAG